MGDRGSRGRITLHRGVCPGCGQSMSGGIRRDNGLLRIRKHNRPGLAGPTASDVCPGGGELVQPLPIDSDRPTPPAADPDADTPPEVAFYDPATNGYDLAADPRCGWGWGDCGCYHGHACFRAYRHAGPCWDAGIRPDPDDRACHTRQRPADWDDHGRAAINA